MKNFTPRERMGLIALAILILILCLADRLAEGLRHDNRESMVEMRVATTDKSEIGREISGEDSSASNDTIEGRFHEIGRKERSDSHWLSDSIRDARRSVGGGHGVSRGQKRKKGLEKRTPKSPGRRSLRDERL